MRIGIYSGSFDPFTNGHLWVVKEGARLFDELHVVIGPNPNKRYWLTEQQRLVMLEGALAPLLNVYTDLFSEGTIVDYIEERFPRQQVTLLRGIRTPLDLDQERRHEQWLRALADLQIAYVICPPSLIGTSSTQIKRYWMEQNWEALGNHVPPFVLEGLQQKTTDPSIRVPMHFQVEDDDLTAMRQHYLRMGKNGLIRYSKEITGEQVREMLDPFPYDLVVSDKFKLCVVPVDKLVATGERYLPRSRSLGPIIVDVNSVLDKAQGIKGDAIILEGKHRWLDAKDGGRSLILAWVGDRVTFS